MRELAVRLKDRSYPIYIGRGLLDRAGELLRLDRRVFILTDAGVPAVYAQTVAAAAATACIHTVPSGEGSKSPEVLTEVLSAMLAFGMTRGDCLVCVGGGVIGDLGGFAAATYMRGIDFYNVPTTTLSQVDSSVGGKVAVNLGGVKNIVGAFYQPKAVLIDLQTLRTLSARHTAAGLVEAVKMAATSDAELFARMEARPLTEQLEDVIEGALRIKAHVVEADEREGGLRKILNFGHTVGHGIEAAEGLHGLYHGECVALGMLPMAAPTVRARLVKLLERLGVPTVYGGPLNEALGFMLHDKKRTPDGLIDAVRVDQIGSCRLVRMRVEDIENETKDCFSI